jgi:phage terminase large subunit-like protein
MEDIDFLRFDPDAVEGLTDDERRELLANLEVLHRERRRTDIIAYASHMEVPGAPSPISQNDRQKLLKRKAALDMRRDRQGAREDLEAVAFDEPDTPEDEWYPKQLEIPDHGVMILSAIDGMMREEPVTGPLANGHEGIVPDGIWLFFSPGSAKSTYASVIAPSYIAGRYPGTDIIGTSYAGELAKRFGRRVRHICRSARYQEVFSATLTGDNQAVDAWSLTNDSTYRSVGVLGGVTGNRADVLFLDDPIAGREEAESEVIREKTHAAIKDDLFTRLKPGGKVVGIMTRWHEDDPAGRLLGETWEGQSGLWKGTDGRWWLVYCVPLIADADDDPLARERGERMWPEWFTDRFVELARGQGDRSWNSLYQQKPSASDGNILLKRYWRCWPHGKPDPTPEQEDDPHKTEPPKEWIQTILCYDTAFEEDEDGDYSAMTAWASFTKKKPGKRIQDADNQQQLILLGGWRGKVMAADLKKIVHDHVEFFMPDRLLIEKRASGIQLIQELRRSRPRFKDMGQVLYPTVEDWLPPFPPKASGKTPRAHAAAMLLEQGAVWYMPGLKSKAIIRECAAFPNGKYDDWTDTVTMMLCYARNVNLLEVPDDKIDKFEKENRERLKFEQVRDAKPMYGRSSSSKPKSSFHPSLYGRGPGKLKKLTDDDDD